MKIRIVRQILASVIEDQIILERADFSEWPDAFLWLRARNVPVSGDDEMEIMGHPVTEFTVREMVWGESAYSRNVSYFIDVDHGCPGNE